MTRMLTALATALALAATALALAATALALAGPAPASAARLCVTSAPSGNCGAYKDAYITNSNGFNTYVVNNCWADPGCRQVVRAYSPRRFTVTSTEPAGSTAVRTAPGVQQQLNNWCPDRRDWSNRVTCAGSSDTPVTALRVLQGRYAETFPHDRRTVAQFAYDVWLSDNRGHPSEIMVWTDNVNRGSGGAPRIGAARVYGQDWTLYRNGSELIWSLGAPGHFARQRAGLVHLRALLGVLIGRDIISGHAKIAIIDAVWEICSTGGRPETFAVSRFALRAVPGR
jgi:hypothetical protein